MSKCCARRASTGGVKRVVLVIVLAAVAGVAIWLTRRGDDAPPPPPPQPAPQPVERPHTTTVIPQLPDQPRLTSDDAGVTSYTIDGIPVRDHRTGAGAGQPLDLPPNLHAPNTRQIPPTLTADVSKQVRGVLADCARLLPAASRGPKPRVDGEVIISIKSGVLSIDRAMMQLRDVVGDPEPMKQCMEQKTVGLTTAAADQADLQNYSIHLSLVVVGGLAPTTPGP
jgi:hypothetical protein